MSITADQYLLILMMAGVLLVTRASGIVLARYLPDSPAVKRVLDVLPGVVLVAVILPDVIASGAVGIIASALVWLVVMRTGNLGFAMLLGVGLVTLSG